MEYNDKQASDLLKALAEADKKESEKSATPPQEAQTEKLSYNFEVKESYTHDEVEALLAEEIEKAQKHFTEAEQGKHAEIEKEFKRKVSYLECKDYLTANGLPLALLEEFDTSDSPSFASKVSSVRKHFNAPPPAKSTEPDPKEGFESYFKKQKPEPHNSWWKFGHK